MSTDGPNTRWRIPIDKIWDHFKENENSLIDNMVIICESVFDDEDEKWWLFMTADNQGNLILSLENSETIINSEVISGPDRVKEATKRLLTEI